MRDWKKARRFFLLTLGRAWPDGAAAALEYIEVCAEGPSGKSMVKDFLDALAFVEKGGGVPAAASLHKNPLVTAAEAQRSRGSVVRLPASLWAWQLPWRGLSSTRVPPNSSE